MRRPAIVVSNRYVLCSIWDSGAIKSIPKGGFYMRQHYQQPMRIVLSPSPTIKDAAQVGLEKESVLGMIYEDRPFELTTGQPITGEFAYELASPMGTTTIPAI